MSDYLFAYGTLQPNHAADEIASAVAKLHPVGKGFVRGVLYDLGKYPGAVLNTSSRKRIIGTVFRLSGDAKELRELDEYEGYDPAAPRSSLFVRELHPVTLADGRTLRCWVYAYNKKPGSARVVSGGHYGKRPTRLNSKASARPQAQKAGTRR